MPKTTIHIPVFVPHAGCPHRCAFCDQRAITGKVQQPGADDVRRIIDEHLATAPATVSHIEVGFFGGSFTAIKPSIQESLLSAVTPYLQAGDVHGIRLSTRPDCLEPAALELLCGYGVTCVELGAQSFDEHVLQLAHRGHTADDTRNAAKRIRAAGLECVIQLMPGLPGDSRDISLAGAREAALLADAVRLYPTVVFAGTTLADMYTNNEFRPLSLEDAIELCAEMLVIMDAGNVRVLRCGLPPLTAETQQQILAGPWHPAFGFLARARLRRRQIEKVIHTYFAAGAPRVLRLTVPENALEECTGLHGENRRWFEDHYHTKLELIRGPVTMIAPAE